MHGILSSLGEQQHSLPAAFPFGCLPEFRPPLRLQTPHAAPLPVSSSSLLAGGYQQLLAWQGFQVDLPNSYPQASAPRGPAASLGGVDL